MIRFPKLLTHLNFPNCLKYPPDMRKNILFLILVLMNALAFGQTSDCNATGSQLTVNATCIMTPFNTANNTDYWNSPAGCNAADRDDAWGYFVATSTSTTITYYSTDNAILHLFGATCSTTMTHLACSNNTTSGNESITFATTIGQTYNVRIQQLNSDATMNGQICVHSAAPPSCSVSAPADQTIGCGISTALTAGNTFVAYNVVSTLCNPIAITGTNAFPTACDDCVTGQIPIGFNFNFFGTVYNTAVISTNGLVGFGPFTFTGYTPFTIPAGGNPNNYIAGLMADIDIRYGGTITYQTVGTTPNRQFVIYYNNVVPYNSGSGAGTGTASFQIVLNENGSFNVILSQVSANWSASNSTVFATSGAENAAGTVAISPTNLNNTDWPGITAPEQVCYL